MAGFLAPFGAFPRPTLAGFSHPGINTSLVKVPGSAPSINTRLAKIPGPGIFTGYSVPGRVPSNFTGYFYLLRFF